MFIIIRDRIKELSEETCDLRELNNYVQILVERLSIKNDASFYSVLEYGNSLKIFKDYLEQTPVYSHQYFVQSKQRVLNVMVGLIKALGERLDIIPEKDYKPNFNDEADLFLALYELEHIGFFQDHPAKHKSYYEHSRLNEHCGFISNQVFFTPNTILTPNMQEYIIEHLNYLRQQFP